MLMFDDLDSLTPAQIPALVTQLGEDGMPGTVAAWALGHLPSEAAVQAAITEGRLDTRQNGYQALAIIAAHGRASTGLAAWLVARIAAELAKCQSGGTGLAEQAARPLAVLGHPDFSDLVQQIIEGDRFCDRFELNRLKTEVADSGRARHLARELVAGWREIFADHLPKPEAKQDGERGAGSGEQPVEPSAPTAPAEAAEGELPAAADLDGLAENAGPKPEKIDWKEFAASPEFTALTPQSQGLVTQLGPLLEQLAAQAIRAMLSDLQGQEFAALLLQVLPQALQPQAVQMALHPHALNGYQALAKYLHRTGKATQGDSLLQGVKLVRTQLRDQLRRSGMLGGPDYSDPDEAALAT
jgi:hypothetical protein